MADFDLSQLMQQAQQMREQMEYLQKGLAEQSVEGSSGGGMVKVKITGAQQVTAIEIDPTALEEDRDMLQDLIVAAVNNALDVDRKLGQERLGSVLPPGLADMGKFPGL